MKKVFHILILAFFILPLVNCPGKKESDNTSLFGLLLLSGSGTRTGSTTGKINNYVWSAGTTTYTEITGTTILAGGDESVTTIDIPFTFSYNNTAYNKLAVGVNGVAVLTSVTTSSSITANSTNMFSSTRNTLAPWFIDLLDDATGTIQHSTSGTTPNQVVTIQWQNIRNFSSITTDRYNFQLKLHESGNKIEFVYGSRSTTASSAGFGTSSSGSNTNGTIGITGSIGTEYVEGKTGSNSTPVRGYRYGDFPARGTIYTFFPQGSGTATTTFDPLFQYQWHLFNYGQLGGISGVDANVVPVWNSGNKGENVRIVIVDDGLDIAHEDLSPNVVSGASYNYTTATTDPSGTTADHGTAIGGIIAARDLNGIGVRGAAPRSSIFGYNLLKSVTTVNIGDSMTRGTFDISNNSWGSPDDTGKFDDSLATTTWKNAIISGLSSQRTNKGAIYLWAAGNGGSTVDNSNYDGQANYYGVITVAAIGDDGKKASYSENGANLWVTSPSQGTSSVAITTTDNSSTNGYNTSTGTSASNFQNLGYTQTFNGTSSATPLVAGVVALMLKANANLTWRDVKLILAETAKKTDSTDTGWITGAAKVSTGNYNFNHKYGFGAIDANAAVTLAGTWTSVGGSTTLLTSAETNESPNVAIPDNNTTGITRTLTVASGAGVGISKIEFVEVRVNSNHTYVGDLDITLTSPTGKESVLAVKHDVCFSGSSQTSCGTFPGNTWRFGTSLPLGESPTGNWALTIKDTSTGDTGNLTSWGIKFYGR